MILPRCIPRKRYIAMRADKRFERHKEERAVQGESERQTSTGICYSSADTTNNARYRQRRYANREFQHAEYTLACRLRAIQNLSGIEPLEIFVREFAPPYKASDTEAAEQCCEPKHKTRGARLCCVRWTDGTPKNIPDDTT